MLELISTPDLICKLKFNLQSITKKCVNTTTQRLTSQANMKTGIGISYITLPVGYHCYYMMLRQS